MQNTWGVHDAENACETKYEEVSSGDAVKHSLPPDAAQSSLPSVPALLPSATTWPLLPSVTSRSYVLTAAAHHVAVPIDEHTDLASVYAAGYATDVSTIFGPYYCACSFVYWFRADLWAF